MASWKAPWNRRRTVLRGRDAVHDAPTTLSLRLSQLLGWRFCVPTVVDTVVEASWLATQSTTPSKTLPRHLVVCLFDGNASSLEVTAGECSPLNQSLFLGRVPAVWGQCGMVVDAEME